MFKKALLPHLKESSTNQAKDELAKVNQDLGKVPFLRGAMHTLSIPAGATVTLNHKLGRTPQGWILCGVTGDMPGFYESGCNDRTLEFTSGTTGDLSLRLWVF